MQDLVILFMANFQSTCLPFIHVEYMDKKREREREGRRAKEIIMQAGVNTMKKTEMKENGVYRMMTGRRQERNCS